MGRRRRDGRMLIAVLTRHDVVVATPPGELSTARSAPRTKTARETKG